MASQVTAYLSIGSNKGDTRWNLSRAVDLLDRVSGIRVSRVSKIYKTAPQNFKDQDWFVNAALEIKTALAPKPLLAALKSIEQKMDPSGKAFRFGPRIIDLDIVLYNNVIFQTRDLRIPHPRMHERSFVLTPLCDIDPDLVHPGKGKRVETLLNELKTNEDQAVIPLDQEEKT